MFTGRSEEKILAWREFRTTLTEWPAHIERVCQEWAKAPLGKNYLTVDDVGSWPDAWTLIGDGIYCDISIALGMFYTLYYSSYGGKGEMSIHHYHLPDRHQTLNLVSLEGGKYMLNYQLGQSLNITRIEDLPNPRYIITADELPIKR